MSVGTFSDVWMWKIGSDPVALTSDASDQINPATDGKTVVWQDSRNGNWDIYLYDRNVQAEKAICTDVADQTRPRMKTGRIVWEDNRRGDKDIYIYENYMP